jgi:hypothetical protein
MKTFAVFLIPKIPIGGWTGGKSYQPNRGGVEKLSVGYIVIISNFNGYVKKKFTVGAGFAHFASLCTNE